MRRTTMAGMAVVISAALSAAPAAADDDPAAPGVGIVRQLYDCQAIADPTQRLACFDRQVAAMQTAEGARDIRIVDRAAVRETRRGLFGFGLSSLNIFGSDDGDAAEQEISIESTITSLSTNSDGKYVFRLANDQRWVQTDSPRGRRPQPGMSITIRRGTLGSYVANINDRPGVRVLRQQ